MSKITDEDYAAQLKNVTDEGYSLAPPGYERVTQWTMLLSNLLTARVNFEWARDEPFVPGDINNILRTQAFFVAAIVAYGRCFAQTAAGFPSLSAKDVYKGSSNGMEVHQRITDIRNKVAAHSDHSDFLRLTLAVKEQGNIVNIRHLSTIMMPVDEIPDFLEAVAHTEHFVTVSLNKQLDYLEKQIGRKIVLDAR